MSTLAMPVMTAESFARFVARVENVDRWFELERGEVVELPPPQKAHGIVCGNVARILGNYAIAAGRGYVTSNDAGFITERDPDSVRGPDVAYWNDTDQVPASALQYTEVPPVVAVDVLSPDDRINRLQRKIVEYLASGVREVWIVNPSSRDVAIHQAGMSPVFLAEQDELDGGGNLPGFQCPVMEFFRAISPAT